MCVLSPLKCLSATCGRVAHHVLFITWYSYAFPQYTYTISFKIWTTASIRVGQRRPTLNTYNYA